MSYSSIIYNALKNCPFSLSELNFNMYGPPTAVNVSQMVNLTWVLRIEGQQNFSVKCTFPNSPSLFWNRENSSPPVAVNSKSEEINQTFPVNEGGIYKCQIWIDNANASLVANYTLDLLDDESNLNGKLSFDYLRRTPKKGVRMHQNASEK